MLRIHFTLIVCASLLTISCSPTKKHFGLAVIENKADTTLTKLEFQKIKSLDNDIFDSATYTGEGQMEIKYRLFKPSQNLQNPPGKYPLVVVYHGSGAIGTDNKSQLGILQKLFASPDIQMKYPAYVLAPQFPSRSSDYIPDSNRNVLTSAPGICLNVALHLVDSLMKKTDIDHKRIYVVGFSMGGSTVINSLSARPDLFAAGISISGIPQFDKAQDIKEIPIWLIHGMDDTENPINSDEQFFKEFSDSHKIRFWKLQETTHDNVFTTTLLGETLLEWLFGQRKK